MHLKEYNAPHIIWGAFVSIFERFAKLVQSVSSVEMVVLYPEAGTEYTRW